MIATLKNWEKVYLGNQEDLTTYNCQHALSKYVESKCCAWSFECNKTFMDAVKELLNSDANFSVVLLVPKNIELKQFINTQCTTNSKSILYLELEYLKSILENSGNSIKVLHTNIANDSYNLYTIRNTFLNSKSLHHWASTKVFNSAIKELDITEEFLNAFKTCNKHKQEAGSSFSYKRIPGQKVNILGRLRAKYRGPDRRHYIKYKGAFVSLSEARDKK